MTSEFNNERIGQGRFRSFIVAYFTEFSRLTRLSSGFDSPLTNRFCGIWCGEVGEGPRVCDSASFPHAIIGSRV